MPSPIQHIASLAAAVATVDGACNAAESRTALEIEAVFGLPGFSGAFRSACINTPSLFRIAEEMNSDSYRVLAFAVCTVIALGDAPLSEKEMMTLASIAAAWAWAPSVACRKVEAIRGRYPILDEKLKGCPVRGIEDMPAPEKTTRQAIPKPARQERTFLENCAALCTLVISTGRPVIRALLYLIDKKFDDIDLRGFRAELKKYLSDPVPLRDIVSTFSNDDERAIAFALCEIVATVDGSLTDGEVSVLTSIIAEWGWTPEEADRKVTALKRTHPKFFREGFQKLMR